MSSHSNPSSYSSILALSHSESRAGTNDGQHFGGGLGQQRDSEQQYPYDARASSNGLNGGMVANATGGYSGAIAGTQDGFQSTQQGQQTRKVGGKNADGSTKGESEVQKGNRLRKACDSCSIRKVKVLTLPPTPRLRSEQCAQWM